MQNTVARIDLGAIRANAAHLKRLAGGAKFYAVVKADAYGHGAVPVARALSGIADAFCVAIVDEGVELRVSGTDAPVLVLAPPMDGDDVRRMAAYGLQATVCDERTARLCAGLKVHIKVNTGMNRYGCAPRELPAVLSAAEKCSVVGVYSHMYAPHIADCAAEQLGLFSACADRVKSIFPSAVAHVSATAGTLMGGEYVMDGVRCGIGLYGYAPAGFADGALRPALKVYARRVQTFRPPVGRGAGYSAAAHDYARLSSYRAGYADGFARTLPLGEGNLCMDAFVSQSEDEELCIFSDADEYAARCGTISYEALCAVTKRSLRVYEG